MKSITAKLYKLHELSEEIQKKVIEAHRYVTVDGGQDWYDYIWDDYKKRIERFFEVGNWYYRGFNSQGDGAMFEYSGIRRPLVVSAIKSLKNITDRERKILLAHLYVYGHCKQIGMYYHEKCHHHLDMEWNDQTAEQSDRHENLLWLLNKVWNDIETFVTDQYERMAKRLYRLLEEGYMAETSDDNVKNELSGDDYWFLENGDIAPAILLNFEN